MQREVVQTHNSYGVSVRLRDGYNAAIRSVRLDDAADLYNIDQAIIEAGIGVVQGLSDIAGSVEEHRKRLEERLEGSEGRLCYAVAERDDLVVGYAQLERFGPERIRHVAGVSVGVHPNYQGRGIGRALMEYVISWAREAQEPPIIRLELGVHANNQRAYRLYKSLGFQQEGVRRRFVREPNGREHDDWLMVLFLDKVT